MNSELRDLYENDEQVKNLIDMSKRLEGLPRHTSMHAAGVVISQKSVDEYVPLSLGSDGSDDDTVYDDHVGRTWTSEDGFPGSADT